jgi:serine protease Do
MRLRLVLLGVLAVSFFSIPALAQSSSTAPEDLRARVDRAVGMVKPALVRIEVISAYFAEGREQKYESSGSGVIVTPEGHVVTNHHVVGDATRLFCTMSTREKIEADLIGKDPLTDIAVIKLRGEPGETFATATWGDSSKVLVGDHVLAMGSPMSLSQSVTLGIISNTEMVMPRMFGPWGRVMEDGEDVGAMVRWLAHDAQIYGGNSGGPLVDLNGVVIGINEISVGGLGGAIPGNVAKPVVNELIASGTVKRSWLGADVQPRLKHSDTKRGVLVSGAVKGTPAAAAGLKPGDHIIAINGEEIDVRFDEQIPTFNLLVAALPVGAPATLTVLRDSGEISLTVTTEEREEFFPQEFEHKQWGLTVRNLSSMIARELKRDKVDGVFITSVRPGGPAGDAKPKILTRDILIRVGDTEVNSRADLQRVTAEITDGKTEPTPVLVEFERKSARYITVVEVGVKEKDDPGLEVKKAWLPVETQVITRELSKHLEDPDLKGFRVTQVYSDSTAEIAGVKVGDFIVAVDGEPLTASAPEDFEELPQLIRQYKIGTSTELSVVRDRESQIISVELVRAPRLRREMKEYEEKQFEFTARDITYLDRKKKKWEDERHGVLVSSVQPGGWAAIGDLEVDDLIQELDGESVVDVDAFEDKMKAIAEAEPEVLVLRVLRGIHTYFLEFEPKWETNG